MMTCPTCSLVEESKALQEVIPKTFGELAQVQERGFESLSRTLAEVASTIEWGFEEVSWQLHEQTTVLRDIAHTLKTPSETQAEELRLMAEELLQRGVLEESEKRFLKALDLNPLDYRTYIGLHYTYLHLDRFDEARTLLQRSLPHAPHITSKEEEQPRSKYYSDEELEEMIRSAQEEKRKKKLGLPWWKIEEVREDKPVELSDYRSYSYRLIGRICMCQEDYQGAVEALKNSVQLSPDYYQGYYDLAQYSALVTDREISLPSLQKAVSGRSFYFYLARKERNFDPLRQDVEELLNMLETNTSKEARGATSQSKTALKQFSKALLLAEHAESRSEKCLEKMSMEITVRGELQEARTLYDETVSKLKSAMDVIDLGSYQELVRLVRRWNKLPGIVKAARIRVEGLHRLCEEAYVPWPTRVILDIDWESRTPVGFRHEEVEIKEWGRWLRLLEVDEEATIVTRASEGGTVTDF
jgi:tetratricopeptide (TPR) repeat protein